MSDEGQALCFMAGASSIFAGDKLLTTPNPDINRDMELFSKLGLTPQKAYKKGNKPVVNENYKNSCSDGEKQNGRDQNTRLKPILEQLKMQEKRKLNQKS